MLLRAGEQYTISLLVRGTVPLAYNYIMNTGVANTSFGSFTYEQPLNEETFVKAYAKITGSANFDLSTGSWFMTRPTVVNAGDWVEITQLKIEKGNKATDWTPAPEDVQAAIDLKANIASPTFTGIVTAPTFAGALIGNAATATSAAAVSLHAGNEVNIGGGLASGRLYVNYNDGGNFTEYGFYGGGTSLINIYANTFYGALSGNASSATKLQTARTIWGQSFNGTANVSGALTSVTDITASGAIQGFQLISTATTGTAPLSVTSTTLVANLNADLLDGYHSSSFATSTHNHILDSLSNVTIDSNTIGEILK